MKKSFFLLVIFTITLNSLSAQNIYHPWVISAGSNYTDFYVIDKKVSDQLQYANWMGKSMPTMLRIGRIINPSFTITGVLSTVTLDVERLNDFKLKEEITSDYFWRAGVQGEYKFSNGYLLEENFWFDPYAFIGVAVSNIEEESYATLPFGIGFNFWPTDYLGVNFQGSYNYLFEFNDYMHYAVGIMVRFGDMIDKDKDRIPDKHDACPEIYGLEKHHGCPDYDLDGVVDSLDLCPKEYGSIFTDGCPDFDKDGVADKQDACPCDPGPIISNGCPENGQHKIIESTQPEPKEKYIETPIIVSPQLVEDDDFEDPLDQDNPFKDPDFPERQYSEIASTAPVEFQNSIEKHLDNIQFNVNSAIILSSSFRSLDEILSTMHKYPDKSFVIRGYTDDTGPTEYNDYLSLTRAKSIKKYFTDKGIDSRRVETRGYGDKDALESNKTAEGRAVNRRVEIYME